MFLPLAAIASPEASPQACRGIRSAGALSIEDLVECGDEIL